MEEGIQQAEYKCAASASLVHNDRRRVYLRSVGEDEFTGSVS